MEIIIALVVFGGILWFYFSRDGKKSDEVVTSAPDNVTAPYKVPEPAATTPIPLVVEAVKPVKAKSPAKPKAPAKAPAKAKAPVAPKAKAPAKPRAPKAKPATQA
jgi:hypothetical protein